MKIKEVCNKTGLTDRAIRLYIANGLVFPYYDENYMGRKNYNFSNGDVVRLNQIAILRKYRFSIKSIKFLLNDDVTLHDFINSHIQELESQSDENLYIIEKLKPFEDINSINVEDFCNILNDIDINREVPREDLLPQNKFSAFWDKYGLIVEVIAVIVIAVLFGVLLIVSDSLLEFFINCFNTNMANSVSLLIVSIILIAEILGIIISYTVIQKNPKKRFLHLLITELVMITTGVMFISVVTKLWLAIIISIFLLIVIYFQEKKIRNLEIKNQRELGIYDKTINTKKYDLTIPELIISAAIGIIMSKFILMIVESTIIQYFE